MPWNEPAVEALLKAGEASVRRARYVLMTINIAGILILAAQFNAYAPWIRTVPCRSNTTSEAKKFVEDFIFTNMYTVSAPILGVKFSAFDLSIVGAFAMLALVIWYFFSIRRENHVIKHITREADTASSEYTSDTEKAGVKQFAHYLYHGVVHYFVFSPINEKDTSKGKRSYFARAAVFGIEYMPFWVPFLVTIIDLGSLFVPHLTYHCGNGRIWDHISPYEAREAIFRMVTCGVISLCCLWVCVECRELSRQSRDRLKGLQQVAGIPEA